MAARARLPVMVLVALVALLAVVVSIGGAGPVRGQPAVEPGPGKLLIANPDLRDPNFSRTVVLLVHHDAEGALGLIINRDTRVELSDAFPGLESKRAATPLFIGGPVDRTSVHVLVRSDAEPTESFHVFDDVHYSRSWNLMGELLDEGSPTRQFRVYAGYSGWGAGQLAAEIARGDWMILEADPGAVFWEDLEKLWRRLLPEDPRRVAAAEVAWPGSG